MKTLKHTLLAFFAFILCFQLSAFEHELSAICKHPAKEVLYISGEFNTILVVDANDGKVLDQIDVDYPVLAMQFAPSGHLLVHGDDQKIHFVNPDTGEESKAIFGSDFELFEEAPYFLDVSWMDNAVIVYDANDGRIVKTIKPDFEPLAAGLSPDFKEVLVLGREREIEKEKTLIVTKFEDDGGYNPFRNAYLDQQSDGSGADFAVYNLAEGKFTKQFVLPYATSDNFDLVIGAYGSEYLLGCWDMMIRIASDGKATPVVPAESNFTYASTISGDGKTIILASSENGCVYNAETGELGNFNVAQDFIAPTAADICYADNKMYLLSVDYTIIQMNLSGVEEKRLKVDKGLTNGFGVYYYNGNEAGEERDSEENIINKVRSEYGWEAVELDAVEESEYLIIGTFETLDEVYEFNDKLDEYDLDYKVDFSPLPKSK
ncbi:MAG: YncE family protein [Fluviicola sp.]